MEWLRSHRLILATIGIAVLAAAAVSLVLFVRRGTVPPSVPVSATDAVHREVSDAVGKVQAGRKTHDERIRDAGVSARTDVGNLSADAVVDGLNALLSELRRGKTDP